MTPPIRASSFAASPIRGFFWVTTCPLILVLGPSKCSPLDHKLTFPHIIKVWIPPPTFLITYFVQYRVK